MQTITMYHNPRCSKSRQTLALLEENGHKATVVDYLKTPPTVEELDRILSLLKMEPLDLMRKKEKIFTELGIPNGNFDRNQLLQLMADNPSLIERPIVIKGQKAAIGRPPESVLDIL
jgi:arsenate reductase (glutaredoxin)